MKRDKSSGFTLIEIVLSIAILAIIMTVAYSALNRIISGKQLLDDKRDLGVIADAVLNRITHELQLASADYALLPPRNDLEEVQSSRIPLRAEINKMPNGQRGDKLSFMAQEGGQYLPDGGSHSGVVQITYRVEKDPDQADSSEATYYLVREETPYIRPFEKAYKKSMIFPISKSLIGLKFRFFDSEKSEWTSSWGEEKNKTIGLPGLIKFTVMLKSPRGRIETYTTTVSMRSAEEES